MSTSTNWKLMNKVKFFWTTTCSSLGPRWQGPRHLLNWNTGWYLVLWAWIYVFSISSSLVVFGEEKGFLGEILRQKASDGRKLMNRCCTNSGRGESPVGRRKVPTTATHKRTRDPQAGTQKSLDGQNCHSYGKAWQENGEMLSDCFLLASPLGRFHAIHLSTHRMLNPAVLTMWYLCQHL